ncbi:hypothetical protein HN51_055469 [Arachis hypogaea]|uniref:C2H2-type domain-containing protein n=1 Tax=Arachis hypogaea TaxID=3818 RepID=A0A6B9VBY5_ARAHY|nr:uncharacterized protein DS421_19g659410 [Arachis hypogaea]
MSDTFYNFRRQGLFNYGQYRSLNNNHQNPISCRICNQVFHSFQALIIHSESHLLTRENNLYRGTQSFSPNLVNSQRERLIPSHHRRLVANSFQPRLTRASPYPYATRAAMSRPPSSTIRPCNFPLELRSSSTLSYLTEMTRLPSSSTPLIHQVEEIMEVSTVDGTRALIDKLNKPIVKNHFVNIINLNDPALDLELNL